MPSSGSPVENLKAVRSSRIKNYRQDEINTFSEPYPLSSAAEIRKQRFLGAIFMGDA